MTTYHRTHPAVEVTLDSGYANVAPTVFVSYVETITAKGNVVIRDQFGYSLTVGRGVCVPLDYDAVFSIVDGKLHADRLLAASEAYDRDDAGEAERVEFLAAREAAAVTL